MEFQDLMECAQVGALLDKLLPSDESVWEFVCREYSRKFSTPLHLVLEMEPLFVLKHFYGDRLDETSVDKHADKMLEMIQRIEDPNFDATQQKELDNFAEQAAKEEEERIKKGVSVMDYLKSRKEPEEGSAPPMPAPKSGFLDLSHLENDDNK